MVPRVAVKLAVLDPDATVTEAGTLSEPVSLDRETLTPPVPAALESVTEHPVLPPEAMLAGEHDTWLTVGGADSSTDVVFELPL